jgi:phage tail tape-measure protein
MATKVKQDQETGFIAAWRESVNDREALLRDPEAHTKVLTDQAQQACAQGVISDEDLRELLEWADSAYDWAVEEQLTRELNQ